MYPDLPFLDRFEAAAKDGFKAVEYLFPYAFPAQELAARLKANGLQQVLFNTPSGGTDTDSFAKAWESGGRGTASVPGRETEFRTGFAQALALHLTASATDFSQQEGNPLAAKIWAFS
jgi:hydroxypyruvate isomerase